MTMKCPACGKENVESAKFCKKCGAYLAWAPTTAAQASEFPATQMAPDFAEPDSDATVIRPVARAAARPTSAPAAAPAPDPLLEALVDRSGPPATAAPGPGQKPSPAQPQAATPPGQDVPVRSGKAGLIVGGLVLLAVLAAALAYWLLGRPTTPEPVRPAVVAPTAPTEPVVAPPPPQSAPPAMAEPVPAAPPVPLAQPMAEPIPAPAHAPAAEAAKPAVKPRPKPVPKAKPAPVQEAPRPSVAPPAPTPTPAPAPVAAPVPAVPAGPSSPAQACEGKSFFGRPACMNEQCGTPRFAKHPQCVELREQNRRREEQQQRL